MPIRGGELGGPHGDHRGHQRVGGEFQGSDGEHEDEERTIELAFCDVHDWHDERNLVAVEVRLAKPDGADAHSWHTEPGDLHRAG